MIVDSVPDIPDMAGLRAKWMEIGFPIVDSVEFEPNLIGWDGVDPVPKYESSVKDDSLNDFVVLTRSSTTQG